MTIRQIRAYLAARRVVRQCRRLTDELTARQAQGQDATVPLDALDAILTSTEQAIARAAEVAR